MIDLQNLKFKTQIPSTLLENPNLRISDVEFQTHEKS